MYVPDCINSMYVYVCVLSLDAYTIWFNILVLLLFSPLQMRGQKVTGEEAVGGAATEGGSTTGTELAAEGKGEGEGELGRGPWGGTRDSC